MKWNWLNKIKWHWKSDYRKEETNVDNKTIIKWIKIVGKIVNGNPMNFGRKEKSTDKRKAAAR